MGYTTLSSAVSSDNLGQFINQKSHNMPSTKHVIVSETDTNHCGKTLWLGMQFLLTSFCFCFDVYIV